MSEFEKIVDEVVEKTTRTSVESIFGENREFDGQTIIPVGKIVYGWGGGGGKGQMAHEPHNGERGEGEGSGFGMGMQVKPMGYINVRPESVSYRPIIDLKPLIAMAVVMAAWVLARTVKTVGRRKTL